MRATFLMAASLCTVPLAAGAQAVSGPYVGLGIGANFLQDERFGTVVLNGVRSSRFNGPVGFDTGFGGVASAGWGFGNGLRVEVEGSYRYNAIGRIPGTTSSGGIEQKYGAMVNALYDLDLGLPVLPYLGVGVGEQTMDWRNGRAQAPGAFVRLQHPDIDFAYQAILGAAYQLPVRGLALTAEYRFLGTVGNHTIYGQYFAPGVIAPAEAHSREEYNHSLMVGLRYEFNAPPSSVQAAPAVPAAQAASRSFLVFFDWDRAELTDRARQVVAEAAQASKQAAVTRIEVSGHTDASGGASHNQALSLRRARSVATELVRLGVPRDAITARGFGETRLLVPTADGVREPQNRRVEILLR